MSRFLPALALVMLVACQASTQVPAGGIQGVALLTSGAPAANAIVAVENSVLGVQADVHGAFLISGLPAGTYALDVTMPGSTDGGPPSSGVHVSNVVLADTGKGLGVGLNLGDVVLGALGTLQGNVDLTGISVTQVTAVLTGVAEVPVNGGGLFTFDNLLPGNYDLNVFALTPQLTARVGGPIAVHISPAVMNTAAGITLGATTMSGTVRGQVHLSGVASSINVAVQIFDADGGLATPASTTTDEEGDYVFTNVPIGIDTVRATNTGFQPSFVPLVVVGGSLTVPFLPLSPDVDAGP